MIEKLLYQIDSFIFDSFEAQIITAHFHQLQSFNGEINGEINGVLIDSDQ